MTLRTFLHAVSMETRTLLSYRMDFWTNFLFGVLTFVVANYFLWEAVFRARGLVAQGDRINGYSLPDMVLYVVLTACLMRVSLGGHKRPISQEIYTGGLNKYLVFPVSFHGFMYASHLAFGLVSLAQLVLALALTRVFLGAAPFVHFDAPLFAVGVVAALAGGYLYFAMGAALEMVAFWADNVWSLNVLLRFLALFLGGGMAPLALYPEWAREALRWTPFPYVLSFPVRCLQGVARFDEVTFAIPLVVGWALVLTACVGLVYRRGLRTYSGVGI